MLELTTGEIMCIGYTNAEILVLYLKINKKWFSYVFAFSESIQIISLFYVSFWKSAPIGCLGKLLNNRNNMHNSF